MRDRIVVPGDLCDLNDTTSMGFQPPILFLMVKERRLCSICSAEKFANQDLLTKINQNKITQTTFSSDLEGKKDKR